MLRLCSLALAAWGGPCWEQVLATREGLVKRRGVRLEYIGLVDSTGYLRAVPRTTLMGSLKGTDNVITLYTRRYNRPLVICGAGAGVEVTAAGVLGDMVELATEYTGMGRGTSA